MADDIGMSESAGSGLPAPQMEEDGTLRASAQDLKERARESSRDLLDQAVEKKDELKARAGTVVDDGRHRVADRAGTLARALHGTADNLEQEGDRQLSQWVHQAAEQVDRVVGYLNGHDAGGLVRDMEDLARRNPALFLGGTYAAGMVLGRFLRASSPERRSAPDAADDGRTERNVAEEPWPGSTSYYGEDTAEREGVTGSGWTGAGAREEGLAEGHTTGGRTDETLHRGQDLGGTPGYGAAGIAGIGSPVPDGFRTGEVRRSPSSFGSEPDAGMTDEDPRTAWHERAMRTDDGLRASNAGEERWAGDRLGTGELTRYTNDERERGV